MARRLALSLARQGFACRKPLTSLANFKYRSAIPFGWRMDASWLVIRAIVVFFITGSKRCLSEQCLKRHFSEHLVGAIQQLSFAGAPGECQARRY